MHDLDKLSYETGGYDASKLTSPEMNDNNHDEAIVVLSLSKSSFHFCGRTKLGPRGRYRGQRLGSGKQLVHRGRTQIQVAAAETSASFMTNCFTCTAQYIYTGKDPSLTR